MTYEFLGDMIQFIEVGLCNQQQYKLNGMITYLLSCLSLRKPHYLPCLRFSPLYIFIFTVMSSRGLNKKIVYLFGAKMKDMEELATIKSKESWPLV